MLAWAGIARVCGVSISMERKWSWRFAGQGEAAFVSKRRGCKYGSGRTLTLAQELRLPLALWSRHAVQDAVPRLFGIEMPIHTVGEYLPRRGFTLQRPARQAIERNDTALHA